MNCLRVRAECDMQEIARRRQYVETERPHFFNKVLLALADSGHGFQHVRGPVQHPGHELDGDRADFVHRPHLVQQRYRFRMGDGIADPTKDMGFVLREARLQDVKNRQNSIETYNDVLNKNWEMKQMHIQHNAEQVYRWAIENGIAKEQARAVLPEGVTKTRLYMSGTLRSWIHYIDVRAEEGTQKEHREIAIQARKEILTYFPSMEDYWSL